jgi:serpin B
MSKIKRFIMLLVLGMLLVSCGSIVSFSGSSASDVMTSDLPRKEIDDLPLNDLEELAGGNTSFALDLFQQIRDEDGNLFFSPYSISAALAMTYAGAAGETESQMESALYYSLGQEKLHSAFNALDQHLTALGEIDAPNDMGDPFQLNIANAIWGQKEFHFEDKFLDTLAENYGAGLRLLDFIREPEESRLVINDWISEKTKDRIQDLIPEGAINVDTRLVLSNAIYFKAAWLDPFDEIFTDAGMFTKLSGDKVPVTMMQGSDLGLPYYQGDGFQAFQMPYVGGEVSMLVILPDEGSYLDFEESLTRETLDQIVEGMEYAPIWLAFPQFEFESELSLATILGEMGMPLAVSPAADFSVMTGDKDLFISDVFHKAFVKVDEQGTEAAAATAVVMKVTSAPADPVEIIVDSPFLFLIREHQTGTVLFMGRVLSP